MVRNRQAGRLCTIGAWLLGGGIRWLVHLFQLFESGTAASGSVPVERLMNSNESCAGEPNRELFVRLITRNDRAFLRGFLSTATVVD